MLSHILRNMTVFIQDGELVVGNQADKPRSAPVFPEFTSEWIVDEIDDFATRKSDPLTLTAEGTARPCSRCCPAGRARALTRSSSASCPRMSSTRRRAAL